MRRKNRPSEPPQSTVRPLVIPEIVSSPAQLDITNGFRYGSELVAAVRSGVRVVIANMSATTFCDSTGIRYLLIGNDAARHHGAELRVVVADPAVHRMMTVLGVDQLLRIYGSMADALSSPSGQTADGE